MPSPLDTKDAIEPQNFVAVNGVPIPAEMAGKAVRRCIRAIQIIDKLLSQQGFCSEDDLRAIRAGLTGEDEDQVADAGAPIK